MFESSRSLSDLKSRSEKSAGRGRILTVLQVNSRSIDQENGEICTGQADLQPISFKSDRFLSRVDMIDPEQSCIAVSITRHFNLVIGAAHSGHKTSQIQIGCGDTSNIIVPNQ
jgi:hypothetical protein